MGLALPGTTDRIIHQESLKYALLFPKQLIRLPLLQTLSEQLGQDS